MTQTFPNNLLTRVRMSLADLLDPGGARQSLASVSARVDDSPGWSSLTSRPHDYDPARVWELYNDALEAWRRNPLAWRIISITTDYVVGDRIEISSPNRSLARYIQRFWNHPKNRMPLRLPAMSDELARAGDLFILLFRNPGDGMSYLRYVTKDRINRIETAPNDWENELAYYEQGEGGEPRRWLSPQHPDSPGEPAVMLHYSVNRPVGALMGESDLTTLIPWLQRYSRMLEDRVRLHWAVRAFLWLVTVPTAKLAEKREQYRTPPEPGSIIVKEENEQWEVASPNLRGADASHDLQAVRGMIDAGSGYPPHWRGEPGDANLATATAMQAPTERHLLRRQQYFTFILEDILFHAYQRAYELGHVRRLPQHDYSRLFTIAMPDISRTDNAALGGAAHQISQGITAMASQLPGSSRTFNRQALRMFFKFAGEPQDATTIDQILAEASPGEEHRTGLVNPPGIGSR